MGKVRIVIFPDTRHPTPFKSSMPDIHSKLAFIPQQFNPVVVKIAHLALPLILRFRTRRWLRGGIVKIEATAVENLVHLYQQFQAGKIRFLIAFHHPEVEDPLCLLYLFSRIIPRQAKQMGVQLKQPIHYQVHLQSP